MASINSINSILDGIGGVDVNSLTTLLDTNLTQDENDANTFEPKLIKQSPYFDIDKLVLHLKQMQNHFTIISLNCESLNAKFDELKIFLYNLDTHGCLPSAICLQETWLTNDSDLSLLQLNNYTLVSQGKICSARGGLAIYIKSCYSYKFLDVYQHSETYEGQFIEVKIKDSNKNLIIGNIYRPPRDINENYYAFIDEFTLVLQKLLKRKNEVVIAGDFNIDLLRIHDKIAFGRFFDTITTLSFYPQITLPTRLSRHRGTIIDNFLMKLADNSISLSNSGIITSRISDHFPYFICLDIIKIKHDSVGKYVQVRDRQPDAINQFKRELLDAKLHDHINTDLHTDPNESYSYIHTEIATALDNHFPVKTVKYKKHKHKKSPWITQGLIRSIATRDRLYKNLKEIPHDNEEYELRSLNLNTYNKILKNNIRVAKKNYFKSCFNRYKNDIKKTWLTINDILNRLKKKNSFPDSFQINNETVTDTSLIANSFNTYFTNIGSNLASQIIPPRDYSFKDYITHPSQHRFVFNLITEEMIINIID